MMVACILAPCAIACVFVVKIMGDKGDWLFWWTLFCIVGFFAFNILAIVVLFSIYNDSLYYDAKRKEDKLNSYNMTVLKNLSQGAVRKKLEEANFKQTAEGFYRKKYLLLQKNPFVI